MEPSGVKPEQGNFNIPHQGLGQAESPFTQFQPGHDQLMKQKRHRRSKNDNEGRNYKCPECGKCYLSTPALTNHRKTKHDYGKDGEKKGRGRPRKNQPPVDSLNQTEERFKKFFEAEIRKPNKDEEKITLTTITDDMNNIFRMCKDDLFSSYETIEKYPFYNLIISNWDKETYDLGKECYSGVIQNNGEQKKEETCPLDGIFFLYLKDVSEKTNKKYFWFLLKFITAFRECINKLRKDLVKKEHTSEGKTEYTQIYNAETIPDICNEFFSDFMIPKQSFGLNLEELIEAVQHFCYWIFKKEYTKSQLTLLENN